ncbi:patatin-like phospholipase family protein [Chryseosolibacter indicus]|uniref:Patatin-like phospholipase family protein n=1 Tax=Chryseosolibacter indicus TaxID=2782351 RepID=A0ABS5VK91_9BACT|nr:patatin-like phospholipase family protein [Chryseosolibacter indicus]MBT1701859.1 patatin-like phospholipase family protein [Chryseosolibacter indicus]
MKVGLVLSGGGARGICHLGVIKALEEFNVNISCISGTSAGALTGALYSYGYKPEEILEMVLKTSFFKSLHIAWTWKGLLSINGLQEVLLKYLPENTFEALKIPLVVAATDIKRGRVEYFSRGELIPTLLGSSCVPAVFDPFRFNGALYIDGGVLDNLPAKAIADRCEVIIGSHCNFISSEFDVKNLRSVVERTLLMAINGNTTISKTLCKVLIEPPDVGKYSGFDLGKAREIFDIGYAYTKMNFSPDQLVIQ